MKRFLLSSIVLLLSTVCCFAQSGAPKGISLCNGASLSVSGSSTNVQLSQCGPSVIVMNLTSQEAFFAIGSSSSTTANTSGSGTNSYSAPGGAYIVITVPTPQPGSPTGGWYFAAITATSVTTLRLLQGSAQ